MPNAIVTGATHGIGKAIAEKLLANGYNVAICARTTADLESCKVKWQSEYPGANILAETVDLSDKQQVQSFAASVIAAFNEIDLLVNNAGLFYTGLIKDEPGGQLERMMEVNLYSAYYLSRAVIPAMTGESNANIVNICSVAGLEPHLNSGSYSITKYAMMGLSENLRLELKDHAIRVTTICPGYTYTRSWEGTGVDAARLIKAEDIAEMVWTTINLSANTIAETIVMRPAKGNL